MENSSLRLSFLKNFDKIPDKSLVYNYRLHHLLHSDETISKFLNNCKINQGQRIVP